MKKIIPLLILISLFGVSCGLGTGQADIVNIIVEESVENIIYDSEWEELSIGSLSVGGSSATLTSPDLDSSTVYDTYVYRNDTLLYSFCSDDELTIYDLTTETDYTLMIYVLGMDKCQKVSLDFTTLTDVQDDEYITISTREELAKIGNDYSLSSNYILIKDIDLRGASWTPIGGVLEPFTGCFEGSNHVISNLTIDKNTENYQGLFGYTGVDASICNLGLEDIDVTGIDYTGGLVGYNDSGIITSCYSTGAVTGTNCTGGLVGYNDSGIITSCYSTGAVTGTDEYTGGLVGCNTGSITSCYSTGAVTGTNYTSGLVGYNSSYGSISSCYSTGTVTGTYDYTGGLVGYNLGIITSCYSTGAVTGDYNTGGLVGDNSSSGSITSCYYDTETSGQIDTSKGTPLTTTQMKSETSYNADDWDFLTTWALDSSEAINSGYPYLMNLIPGE